jgi:hypothetical protein
MRAWVPSRRRRRGARRRRDGRKCARVAAGRPLVADMRRRVLRRRSRVGESRVRPRVRDARDAVCREPLENSLARDAASARCIARSRPWVSWRHAWLRVRRARLGGKRRRREPVRARVRTDRRRVAARQRRLPPTQRRLAARRRRPFLGRGRPGRRRRSLTGRGARVTGARGMPTAAGCRQMARRKRVGLGLSPSISAWKRRPLDEAASSARKTACASEWKDRPKFGRSTVQISYTPDGAQRAPACGPSSTGTGVLAIRSLRW